MSLIWRICLLVALALVPPLALQLYGNLEARASAEEVVRGSARRLSQFAASELDKVLEGARLFLLAVAVSPDVRSGDVDACNAYLADLAPMPPYFRGAFVIAPDGNIVCSTSKSQDAGYAGDREYFRRAVASGAFAIGDAVVSRADGALSLPVALPIFQANGELRHVLAMGVSTAELQAYFRERAWPESGSISVIDRTGTILVRWPTPELIGGQLSEPFRWMLAATEPGTTEGTGPDGVARIGGYLPPAVTGGLLVSVALSRDAAMAPLRQSFWRGLILLAGAALLASTAAVVGGRRFIVAPIERLQSAAARLAAGDLTARADLLAQRSELGRLGATFDVMAAASEARETALGQSEERFRRFAEAVPEVIWVIDLATDRFEYVSPAYQRVSGRSPDALAADSKDWRNAIDRRDLPEVLRALLRVRHGDAETIEFRIVGADDAERWLRATAFPIRDAGGVPTRIGGIARDVTERRRLEEERARALSQRDLLLQELNHRVKNQLQIVGSFLRVSSRRIEDEDGRLAVQAASRRLGAVGELYTLLHQRGDIDFVDLGAYLLALCDALRAALSDQSERITIEPRCDPVPAPTDTALSIGLIVSELVTNSLKYAFPQGATGRVVVSLQRTGGDRVRLGVRDDGPGLTGGQTDGFGLQVVRMLAGQLGASLTTRNDGGAVFELELDLPPVLSASAAA